ncbi:copper chaperone PCu(A)C [Alteromonas pelagimontana]|uniref:Copper chaperone PCu(A)C n=1 Tax=Alteromonas pelagimontana TaxID=1858656 RepID=A0A6M4MEB1_9ALTE|nr:copper chaperone PCu(A)C [Alteromonas pelagimontana]QJR80496.1 copper chaperone PCu(A)C [Alteromonas pelagimontana]
MRLIKPAYIVFASFCVCLSSFAVAAAGKISVSDVYARATFPMAETAAVYMQIENSSDASVTLQQVTVSEELAADAQLHTTLLQGDMAKMRALPEGVAIPAKQRMQLSPAGHHIMLTGLKKGLAAGDTVPLVLKFSNGLTIDIKAEVRMLDNEGAHHHHQ